MENAQTPTPEQIKKRIQDAYLEAVSNRNSFRSRSGSGTDSLIQGVKLYGSDAGVDFIETHLTEIVQEAVEEAKCKQPSLTFPTYGFGRLAMASMVERLRDLTNLTVSVSGKAVVLTWGDTTPRLV